MKKKKDKSDEFFKFATIVLTVLFIVFGAILMGMYSKSCQDSKEDVNGNPVVVIETSMGNIEVELYPEDAPVTVDNFLSYVNVSYYDGLVFHRVIDGFMIQGGGFYPDGVQKETNEPIVLESNNNLSNTVGTIAMARTMVPDSATSQFFINVNDNLFLDYTESNPGYTVFGKVTSGMEVVNSIKGVETGIKNGMQDWPSEDVIIKKVYIKNVE